MLIKNRHLKQILGVIIDENIAWNKQRELVENKMSKKYRCPILGLTISR